MGENMGTGFHMICLIKSAIHSPTRWASEGCKHSFGPFFYNDICVSSSYYENDMYKVKYVQWYRGQILKRTFHESFSVEVQAVLTCVDRLKAITVTYDFLYYPYVLYILCRLLKYAISSS